MRDKERYLDSRRQTEGYFDNRENVEEHIRIAEGFDGRELVARLREVLDPGSSVLELGMGPGKDLEMLAEQYRVTGSDLSDVFLRLYHADHPDADLLQLDAVSLDTARRFDCIYTNKVLHHISREDLRKSFQRQSEVLNDGGIVLHTFWRGSGTEMMGDLRFVYYVEDDIQGLAEEAYKILALDVYSEMADDDSLLLIARRE